MSDQVAVFVCACGCGKQLRGSRRYFPGHKPARVNKSKEEKSVSYRARWERWRQEHPDKQPKPCACGCGEMVKGTWAHGHHVRTNNPYTKPEVQQRSKETRGQMRADGTFPPTWNKGLTKDTDARVATIGILRSQSFTDEERQMHSEKMQRQWTEGKIVPLTGPDHPRWKGGVSTIVQRCRGSSLTKLWKLPILRRDGFRCTQCGRGSDRAKLAVHHDGERFAHIVHECMPDFAMERELSWEEQSEVVERITQYHVEHAVTGVTLCWDCHRLAHADAPDVD